MEYLNSIIYNRGQFEDCKIYSLERVFPGISIVNQTHYISNAKNLFPIINFRNELHTMKNKRPLKGTCKECFYIRKPCTNF